LANFLSGGTDEIEDGDNALQFGKKSHMRPIVSSTGKKSITSQGILSIVTIKFIKSISVKLSSLPILVQHKLIDSLF
jgi:hypothetical protein